MLAATAWGAEPTVPYVPTPQDVVERMLQIAKVSRNDYLIDLGSGDGRIVITAAKKYGTRGFGVDLNPVRISESNENARKAGVTDKVAFYQRDLFETDLSEATVITMYLLPRVNMELRPKLLRLKPGTRIVSHDFSMEDWKPDTLVRMDVKSKYGDAGGSSDIYFWVVPANVAGVWRWQLKVAGKTLAYEAALDQKFQAVSGSAKADGRSVRLQNTMLRGDRLSFTITMNIDGAPLTHRFSGKVDGGKISGSVMLSGARIQARLGWEAERASAKTAATSNPNPIVLSAANLIQ